MISASDFKRAVRVLVDDEPFVIIDVKVQSPSARGASTLVKAKMRNLRTGQLLERTFRASDKVDEPQIELRPVQYLYNDGETFEFMDANSYEQFSLSRAELGDDVLYLKEGLGGLRSIVFNDKVISIELPQTITLTVTETDPPLKGATAQAQTKPATLETGLVIQVPSYLESGEAIAVDTREARFISRAKN